ncbi:phage tail assembly protein [Rahnella aceris]|uniref:phage tail assembly protein n=1 Tax=Rahnella sp. (strain Y9602) TaxID=2703885 RepID=UPI001C255581|nr:phage tail assembly protein [Rahnella aceris]MBU9866818.1 phage tail assembly protein [Rahnella aceris]
MTQTVALSAPISANGEMLSELVLQSPNIEQIKKIGIPMTMDSSGNFGVNAALALKYVPELAGVPPSSLKNLTPFDISNLCWAVWRFFMVPPTTPVA